MIDKEKNINYDNPENPENFKAPEIKNEVSKVVDIKKNPETLAL
jgi:hypothetical protein